MSLSVRPPFPKHVDSTIRGSFTTCPRKAELEYFRHFKPRNPNVHLHAGGAFASGLEAARRAFYSTGMSTEDAIAEGAKETMRFYGDFEEPSGSPKSMANTVGAIGEYFNHYGFTTDSLQPFVLPNGEPAVELSFALPIDVLHPVSGDPILLHWPLRYAWSAS